MCERSGYGVSVVRGEEGGDLILCVRVHLILCVCVWSEESEALKRRGQKRVCFHFDLFG